MRNLWVALVLALSSLGAQAAPVQGLLQMLDYLAVDYPEAVQAGKVVSAAEYAEMQEFTAGISSQVAGLDKSSVKAQLVDNAKRLERMVAQKQAHGPLADLVATMRSTIIGAYPVNAVPRKVPDMAMAQQLFQQQCATCHGAEGRGDGPAGQALEPAPTDFHDYARHSHRTLYGLYNTITLGVDGTGMSAYNELSDQQRWSLAFYVGQMAAKADMVAKGRELWQRNAPSELVLTELKQVTTLSPAQANQRFGKEGGALHAYLRNHPEEVFAVQPSPLSVASENLEAAKEAYQGGRQKQAYDKAVTAYLEGFELVESGLSSVAPELLQEVEQSMTALRNQIRNGAPVADVVAQIERIQGQVEQADEALATTELSSGAAFTGSLIVLLREGLEAILVIAAIAAFLVKTGRTDGMRYLHYGWISALIAGGATWYAATYLWSISGATREMTEAVAALIAASVLFYVGFWLHSKTNASRWQQFIEHNVNRALNSTTLWSLTLLSFITVYREAFETILFYQALWSQAGPQGHGSVLSGLATAAVALLGIGWVIFRYSTRLPLRQFFAVTGLLVFVLAVVFAGKGIAALQEAGRLAVSPVNLPSFELLGIYPNIQGLAVQLLMVVTAVVYLYSSRKQTPKS